MANEARVYLRGSDTSSVITFTIADAAAIAKGTVMVFAAGAADKTVVAHSAVSQRFIGIADESKDANDGQTSLAVFISGIVEFIAGGAISAGDYVKLDSTANRVVYAGGSWASYTTSSFEAWVGKAIDATSAAGETVRVRLWL